MTLINQHTHSQHDTGWFLQLFKAIGVCLPLHYTYMTLLVPPQLNTLFSSLYFDPDFELLELCPVSPDTIYAFDSLSIACIQPASNNTNTYQPAAPVWHTYLATARDMIYIISSYFCLLLSNCYRLMGMLQLLVFNLHCIVSVLNLVSSCCLSH